MKLIVAFRNSANAPKVTENLSLKLGSFRCGRIDTVKRSVSHAFFLNAAKINCPFNLLGLGSVCCPKWH